MELELDKIKPNHLNPRTSFTKEGLDELAGSIKTYGVLEPIIVRKTDDLYEVVVGERRYRASKMAGLKKIPCIVRDLNDNDVLEFNLVENVMREDLTEVEKGRCCKRLMDEFPNKYQSIGELSHHLGVTKWSIRIWIETADKVSPEIEEYIAPANPDTKRVPEGKVRSYDVYEITRRIKEPEKQLRIVKKIAKKRMPINNLRKVTEKIVKQPNKTVDEIFEEFENEPAEMPFRLSHMEPILNGVKIQTSRKFLNPKIREGAIIKANVWQPNFARLKVKKIIKKNLEEFTEDDAKREGGYTLSEFKKVWKSIHGVWNPNDTVNVIIFEKSKEK